MVRDAVRCHFEEVTQSHLIRLHWVKDEVIPAWVSARRSE